MRKDMSKVVVERPRRNRYAESSVKGRVRDFDDLPSYEGMKAGRRRGWNRKETTDNLNPLRRYLKSQVGRKWNDVYSDICEHNNLNNTVQHHVLLHVPHFVEINTIRLNGKVYSDNYPITSGLYVDPLDGVLRAAGDHKRHRWSPRHREDYVEIDDIRAFQRLNGIWFEILYTIVPPPVTHRVELMGHVKFVTKTSHKGKDVIAGRWPCYHIDHFNHRRPSRYAHAKRPLTSAELKAAGLVNDPELLPLPGRRRGERH